MRRLGIALLLCSVAMPAWALSEPTPSAKDAQVRTETYDPGNRIKLVLQAGGITNITFDTMEVIERAVRTDQAPFTYPLVKDGDNPMTNNLELIGLKPGTGTLTVVTRHGIGAEASPGDVERAYNFAIEVVPAPADGKDDPHVTYQLTFNYPAGNSRVPPQIVPRTVADPALPTDTPSAPRPLTPKQKKDQQDAIIMTARMQASIEIGPQNTRYVIKGRARNIAPLWIVDNSQLTGFRYPGNMPQPAVFKVTDGVQGTPAVCSGGQPTSGELQAPEESVNTSMRNDYLTVQETWPHWRLRQGDAVLDIWNCAYDPVGFHPPTGTESSDLIRTVIRR